MCKFTNQILITQVFNKKQIDYAFYVLNVHFVYLMICMEETQFYIFDKIFFALTINFLRINFEFSECVRTVLKLGFRQQSFFAVQNIFKF